MTRPQTVTEARIARDAAFEARRDSAIAALFPGVKTWADARRALASASVPLTLRRDPAFASGGYEVFPKGYGQGAVFVTSPADAVLNGLCIAHDESANRLSLGGRSYAGLARVTVAAALAIAFPASGDRGMTGWTVDTATAGMVGHFRAVTVAVTVYTARGVYMGSFHEAARDFLFAEAALELAWDLAGQVARDIAEDARLAEVAAAGDSRPVHDPVAVPPALPACGEVWTPSRSEVAAIRAAAAKAARTTGCGAVTAIDGGLRVSTLQDLPASLNVRLVDGSADWNDSDLSGFVPLADVVKAGVALDRDGRACVDFYIYARDGLACNVQAYADRDGLVAVLTLGPVPGQDVTLWQDVDCLPAWINADVTHAAAVVETVETPAAVPVQPVPFAMSDLDPIARDAEAMADAAATLRRNGTDAVAVQFYHAAAVLFSAAALPVRAVDMTATAWTLGGDQAANRYAEASHAFDLYAQGDRLKGHAMAADVSGRPGDAALLYAAAGHLFDLSGAPARAVVMRDAAARARDRAAAFA